MLAAAQIANGGALMRLTKMSTLFVATFVSCVAQDIPLRRRVADDALPSKGVAIVHADVAVRPTSLQELYSNSEVIVAGSVERQLPSRAMHHLETDVIFTVDQVLKGDPKLKRVVVAELGGRIGEYQEILENDSNMRTGEHYILFLAADKRPDLPDSSGVPRFTVVGLWAGKVRSDGGVVRVSSGATITLRNSYDGLTVADFIARVRSFPSR